MRTNDILLDGFNDIRTLQRYLYMSDEHYIEIENVIGVKLRIRMAVSYTHLTLPTTERV